MTPELVREVLDEETAKIRESVGDETWEAGRPDERGRSSSEVALSPELIEFLTLVPTSTWTEEHRWCQPHGSDPQVC